MNKKEKQEMEGVKVPDTSGLLTLGQFLPAARSRSRCFEWVQREQPGTEPSSRHSEVLAPSAWPGDAAPVPRC